MQFLSTCLSTGSMLESGSSRITISAFEAKDAARLNFFLFPKERSFKGLFGTSNSFRYCLNSSNSSFCKSVNKIFLHQPFWISREWCLFQAKKTIGISNSDYQRKVCFLQFLQKLLGNEQVQTESSIMLFFGSIFPDKPNNFSGT